MPCRWRSLEGASAVAGNYVTHFSRMFLETGAEFLTSLVIVPRPNPSGGARSRLFRGRPRLVRSCSSGKLSFFAARKFSTRCKPPAETGRSLIGGVRDPSNPSDGVGLWRGVPSKPQKPLDRIKHFRSRFLVRVAESGVADSYALMRPPVPPDDPQEPNP